MDVPSGGLDVYRQISLGLLLLDGNGTVKIDVGAVSFAIAHAVVGIGLDIELRLGNTIADEHLLHAIWHGRDGDGR